MLQILPIALAQVKAGNTSENLLNQICQIIYSFCLEKEITVKKVQQYNEFNEVIKQNGTIFMNSKNSGTCDPHRPLLNLSDKLDLKRSDKHVA